MNRLEATWTFKPANLFEEATVIGHGGAVFWIENGTVCLTEQIAEDVSADFINTRTTELHRHLEAMFLAANVLAPIAYELSDPGSIGVVKESGQRDGYGFPKPGIMKMTGGAMDVIAPGVDTRAERISDRKALGKKVAEYITDATADKMLRSLAAAVHDPQDEFTHLYEVRDALKSRFKREETAQQMLRISPKDWDRFGALTNGLPVQQSRHRGLKPGELRSATPEELTEARTIARRMLLAYLAFLDNPA